MMKGLKYKVQAIFRIIFRTQDSWVLITLTPEQRWQLIMNNFGKPGTGKEYEPKILHYKMQEYTTMQLLKDMAESIDENELVLKKAEFEYKASLKSI